MLALVLVMVAAAPAQASGARASGGPRPMVRGDVSGFRLPFKPGREVAVRQGWHTTYSHRGRSRYAYDFGLPMWTPIVASAAGTVAFTRTGNTKCGGPKMRKFANLVTINHPDGSATQYGHLSTVNVRVGDVVRAGQVIGRSGKTGYTNCRPHLHFARQLQGDAVTQSIPIYFQGYESRRLVAGDIVEASDESCVRDLTRATARGEATESFCGVYYTDEFGGDPVFSRSDGAIDVDRTEGGPGGYWLDATAAYSVRWSGRFELAPSWYTLRVEATGAVRVWLDGVLIADDWVDVEPVRVIELTRRPWAGIHTIEVEHFTQLESDRIRVDFIPLLLDA